MIPGSPNPYTVILLTEALGITLHAYAMFVLMHCFLIVLYVNVAQTAGIMNQSLYVHLKFRPTFLSVIYNRIVSI